ncbi:MAG: hypothetical protein EAX95_10425 [Candidatus Thorarchaeota archaeon]|nr:hypothetical protein [Candidatus Thorarchaeota archaeon]
MQVNSLYIIKRDTGVCMYHHDFGEAVFDPHLLSSFLVAMTSFFDEATRSVKSKARAFEGTDHKIVVEFGDWILGAVSAKEDSAQLRDKIKRLIGSFEEQFGLLRWVDLDLAVYTRFERNVIEEFVREEIQPDTVIEVKNDWEYYTSRPAVVSFLRVIPPVCSIEDAAKFLEVPVELALNMAAEAYWEKAIRISHSAHPDDIYQTTALSEMAEAGEEISFETASVLLQLDGETPLSIAAERVSTSDLKKFLDDIGRLAQQRAVELVSPSQATTVLYSTALQNILKGTATILGINTARKLFYKSRNEVTAIFHWLAFVELESGVDVEIKTTLNTAAVKGSIAPESLAEGFDSLFQRIVKKAGMYMGIHPINSILCNTRSKIEKQFPRTAYGIQWELLTV